MMGFLRRLATVVFFPVAVVFWLFMLYSVILLLPAELVFWLFVGDFFEVDDYFSFILGGFWAGYFGL